MGKVGIEPTTYDVSDRYSKPTELLALIYTLKHYDVELPVSVYSPEVYKVMCNAITLLKA